MARQDQSVEGGTAYQAQGNITVTHGMGSEQMAEVMVAMARHLQVHFAEAEAKLEERLTDFRKAVLEEFAKPENLAASDAFREPDFQFVLNDAQKVFARDGSADLRDDLVRLLVQRSMMNGQDRSAKILNHAIEIAGSLSRPEYAALALNFLVFHVKFEGGANYVLDTFSEYSRPFINDLSFNDNVYEYLESQRCASINRLTSHKFNETMVVKYAHIFITNFSPEAYASREISFPIEKIAGVIGVSSRKDKPYSFACKDKDALNTYLKDLGVEDKDRLSVLELYSSTVPAGNVVGKIFEESVTGWDRMSSIWELSTISHMTLTAVGKAIGHSALASKTSFSAPLNIWIN